MRFSRFNCSLKMNVLYVLFALDVINLSVYLPIFSAHVRALGATSSTVGFINSSSALISLLWNPIVGSLSDAVGRKGLLKKCMFASLLGSLVLSLSSSSLLLVFIGKLIGACGSPINILLRTIVADTYKTSEEKKQFFDKSAPFLSFAFLFGSLSSGFLSEAENGRVYVFLFMASTMGLAMFVAHQNLPNDIKSKDESQASTSLLKRAANELKLAVLNIKTISWPRYWALFTVKGLFDFSMTMLLSNIGLILLNEFNIAGRSMGYVFVLTSIFTILSNVLKLKLKETCANIPDYVKVIYGGMVLAVSFLGMSLASTVYAFLVFIALVCMARAFVDTTFTEMISIQTRESDRGKVIGAFDNLGALAMFLAPVSSGLLADAFGQRTVIALAAGPALIGVIVAYRQKNKTE